MLRAYQSKSRPLTPPEDLIHSIEHSHPKTPSRSVVLGFKLLAQKKNIRITQQDIQEVFRIPRRVQSRILASKHVRTLYNLLDSGPDPQGRPRKITRQETAAIADYLADPNVPLFNKGAP
jgi:hypothetical protein